MYNDDQLVFTRALVKITHPCGSTKAQATVRTSSTEIIALSNKHQITHHHTMVYCSMVGMKFVNLIVAKIEDYLMRLIKHCKKINTSWG